MAEKVIDVYVANEGQPLTIRAVLPVPELVTDRDYLQAYLDAYQRQGRALVKEMLLSMPGGLIDAVLVALLDHKRSIFRVPLDSSALDTEGK